MCSSLYLYEEGCVICPQYILWFNVHEVGGFQSHLIDGKTEIQRSGQLRGDAEKLGLELEFRSISLSFKSVF